MIFNKFKREKNKKIETMAENDKGIRAQSDNQGEEIKHAPDKLIVEKEVKKLTKEESNAKMNEYYQKEELYVFLSNANADYEQGYSVPFLGQEPDDKIVIYIFSTIEKAKKHIKKIKLQLVDGIGSLTPTLLIIPHKASNGFIFLSILNLYIARYG